MAITGIYFIDTSRFDTATKIWEDSSRTTLAPDGYYSINNVYRQQLNGLLLPVNDCLTPISATIDFTAISCYGGSDGSITISNVSGGTGGLYSIKLNSDGSYEALITTKTYTSLTSSNYVVYIKDNNGNVKTFDVTVTQPEINVSTITAGDASLTASSTGGVWPKTYRLYKDTASPYVAGCGDTLIETITDVTLVTKDQVISNLTGGYYCLEVTDANGCIVNSGLVEIMAPTPTPTPTPTSVQTINYLIQDCETGLYWNAQKTQTFEVGDVVEFLIKINREFIHCGTIINDNYLGVSDVTLYSAIVRSCDDDTHCGIENPTFLSE
jgi:hypothetical protein